MTTVTLTDRHFRSVQPGQYPGAYFVPVAAGSARAEAMRATALRYGRSRVNPVETRVGVQVWHLMNREALKYFHARRREIERERHEARNPFGLEFAKRVKRAGVVFHIVHLLAQTHYLKCGVGAMSIVSYRDAYTEACRQARVVGRDYAMHVALALPRRLNFAATMADTTPGAPQFRRRYIAERLLEEARDGKMGDSYYRHPRHQIAQRVMRDPVSWLQPVREVW